MTRYTSDSRDRVLDAVDMVALVSTRTELRRAGVNSYFGICPFHDERTPSFHVRPDEKHYHCFGCQASGDPFDFVMETEGLDFKAAIESLADRFGIKLETEAEDPAAASRRQRRERLHGLLARATAYYARYLWDAREAAPARDYLLRRGLGEETLKTFRVGYAPSAWDRILLASRSAGFSDDELLAVGLAQRSRSRPGQVYDRFRERIMFPSADARGRVRGFGARAMRENQQPKYLNTSDGELYHKRSQLFGIDLARAAAARAGRMVLVEGYTDVLALHQAGLTNAVGIMGTALTEEQVNELERTAKVLELCLDADRAGQDAMLRAAQLAEGRKLELRVVPLPDNTDPAELIEREGADALRALVEHSVPFVVFHVDRILDRADTSSAEGRDRAALELAPVLDLPPSALREDLLRRVASRLELSEGRLAALLARGSRGGGGPPPPAGKRNGGEPSSRAAPEVPDPTVRTERAFLILCVALPEPGRRALSAIDPEEHLTSERMRRVARHLAGQTEMPMTSLAADDDELARAVEDIVARAGRAGEVTEHHIEQQRMLLERGRVDRAIRRARGGGRGDVTELVRERERVWERIRELDARLERPV
ncbi:MAG: DNA primase [Solirubrobacterales bacterium]|nr:DNA primase [Solirubrobacterales bacterium]